MSKRNTVVRSAHDIGLAAWFGGSLMGAVGLNAATAQAKSSQETLRLSSLGWGYWTPVNTAAIGAHVLGGLGLMIGNKDRIAQQDEARRNTATKTVLTLVGIGITAYSGMLGKKVYEHQNNPTEGATEPSSGTDEELASAQRQLKYCQWAVPAVTGFLLILGAQQGEQQRPREQALSRVKGLFSRD